MIGVSTRGNFDPTKKYLNRIKSKELFKNFEQYGRMGVAALNKATPRDTGETAQSWDYKIIRNHRWPGIEWFNTNTVDGTPVAILIQYDHSTGTGGFVQGRDFINPAMRPIFSLIVAELRKKVNS
jgi:hypothetical protein